MIVTFVILGLAIFAAMAVGVRWIASLPYCQPHAWCVPQEQETQEASYEPAGGGRAG